MSFRKGPTYSSAASANGSEAQEKPAIIADRASEAAAVQSSREHRPRMRKILRDLNNDQIRVVSALTSRMIEANRSLADATSRMRRAALRDNRRAFGIAQEEAQQALKDCEACALAFQTALDAIAHPAILGDQKPSDGHCLFKRWRPMLSALRPDLQVDGTADGQNSHTSCDAQAAMPGPPACVDSYPQP